MTSKPTEDEKPKRKIARRVITAKRLYFVPEHGVSVEAESAEAAVRKAREAAKSNEPKEEKEQEVGDA